MPPVDYLTALPDLYARAVAVLNVTSLLLPHSLSQRHFDVWAAGGICLSDDTPGLGIFPQELVSPTMLEDPAAFADRMDEIRTHPQRWCELRQAWRNLIVGGHTYEDRLRSVCDIIGIPSPRESPLATSRP
jgi:spore maturation protein CgeB